MMHNENMMSNPEGVIIPVASGKGGVGKTFLTANLAIALAEMGHRINRQPFLPNYHNSLAAENITRIASRIVKFWNQPVKDSAALLLNHVQKDFENRLHSAIAA